MGGEVDDNAIVGSQSGYAADAVGTKVLLGFQAFEGATVKANSRLQARRVKPRAPEPERFAEKVEPTRPQSEE